MSISTNFFNKHFRIFYLQHTRLPRSTFLLGSLSLIFSMISSFQMIGSTVNKTHVSNIVCTNALLLSHIETILSVFYIIMIISSISVLVLATFRRFNDTGLSYNYKIMFFSLIALSILISVAGEMVCKECITPGVQFLLWLLIMVMLFWLMIRVGDDKENQYGITPQEFRLQQAKIKKEKEKEKEKEKLKK